MAFADALDRSPDIGALTELFRTSVEPLGVTFFMCAQFTMPGGIEKTTRLFGAFDHPWFLQYDRQRLFLDDASVRLLKAAHRPYRWQWMQAEVDLSVLERNVFSQARRFGLNEGLIVPFHGPFGALAGASVAGPDLVLEPHRALILEIMVERAYQRALVLHGLFQETPTPILSNRQRECLNWAQHGKSDKDIAAILGISAYTVKEHMDAAKKVFGVTTRIEAVVHARHANLINFAPMSVRSGRGLTEKTD